MVNETQGLIALGTFTTIVALIPILMNIFMKAPNKKKKHDRSLKNNLKS
ncbi:hypothetical protein [Arcobacter porcinus]|jgi:hypothetical protein|uniref:Uncharacterized protein n=1 Tax=Arcobacter porcinus TaxID=1935204 RepID=A0ABX2YF90_9BACT|nr:hypothetical protein [Arcobacter porcinus]OCL93463.1 hypothetical protein AAX28_01006 [Arcobacter porcinus]